MRNARRKRPGPAKAFCPAWALAIALAVLGLQAAQPACAQEPTPTPTPADMDDLYAMLDSIHDDVHAARHAGTVMTTTFELEGEAPYQIATIGTYTDGERVMIALLLVLVILEVYQFARKEANA